MNDTIVAIGTPPGTGAVGIIRMSGSRARSIASHLFSSLKPDFAGFKPHRLHHGHVCGASGQFLDEALVVYMPGPRSFTGDDVIEFHCHGGGAVLRGILEECLTQGARLAEPGEFSKRAFLNGRMDLTQAEAVMELINAPSGMAVGLAGTKLAGLLAQRVAELRAMLENLRVQLCVAVDFPEDEVECLPGHELNGHIVSAQETLRTLAANHERARCWRDGALVVLAGQVNAGKSSLMNAILGINRAIVTDIPGTTRDYLEESIRIDGLPVRLVDTAGLRTSLDAVERMGIERSRDLMRRADLVLLLIDAELGPGAEDMELARDNEKLLIAANKMDLVDKDPTWCTEEFWTKHEVHRISAKHGHGLTELLAAIASRVTGEAPLESDVLAPNLRQRDALTRADEELELMRAELGRGLPYDVLAVRLDMACAILGEITGEIASEDILKAVFDGFCIGK